jgi:WD40 repeat protein
MMFQEEALMYRKRILIVCMMFVFLFTFPMVISAQADLTQTYTSPDGTFSISYPASWTLNDQRENVTGFNGDAGFLEISFYDNNDSGYAPVTALEYLEVGIGEEPDLRTAMEYNEPEELVIAGFPALQSGSNLIGQLHTVIDFGDGVLGKAIGFVQGDLAAATPTFMAMLNSIQYGDGTQSVAQEPLDSIEPITPANAAGIAQIATLGDAGVAVESVAFSPDGSLLGAALADGTAQVWNVDTRELVATLTDHLDGATSIAFDTDGNTMVVGAGNGQVQFWDATTGDAVGSLEWHDAAVTSIAFNGDDLLLATGAADGSVKVWDNTTGSEIALDDNMLGESVGGVAFSQDGAVLFAGGGNIIRLWDTTTGAVLTSLESEISDISSINTIGGGMFLLYGGADAAVWVWDLDDESLPVLGEIDPPLSALAVSTDVTLLASADAGGVRLWDIATTANLVTLPSPSGEGVNTVAFNPAGTLLASGGPTGGVVLWGISGEGGATQTTTPSETTTTTTTETTPSTAGCTFSAPGEANLRSGPGTTFDRAGALSAGQTVEVDGQAQGTDGMTWYRLTDGAWVRSDVVGAPAACATVPVVAG